MEISGMRPSAMRMTFGAPEFRRDLLTGYLPPSSIAHLPTLSMRREKTPGFLACITHATRINSAAT